MSDCRISICIVSYQTRDYLRDCLDSIADNPPEGDYEIIVVDNNSGDGTPEMLTQAYPHVHLIRNPENRGYTAPMNQALRAGQGAFLLQLNPDTLLLPGALETLIEYQERHPEVGICGPKVLNIDGSMQKSCRRGESRPWAVITYFLGLSRAFPQSRAFGGYHLNYLPEDEFADVAGVSGSCMLIRREVTEKIGFLDERYFAYQEDADFCFRTRQAGWKVVYVPTARITHYGGEGGSRVHPYRSIIEWHRSYWLYYRKNLSRDYFFLFNWLYYLLMLVKLAYSLGLNALRRGRFAG